MTADPTRKATYACPYQVVAGCGLCCLGDPCDLVFTRPCDAQGGCWDRPTCGDCSEPDIEATLADRARRALAGMESGDGE